MQATWICTGFPACMNQCKVTVETSGEIVEEPPACPYAWMSPEWEKVE